MNNLTVINNNGQLVIDSREVAEMIGKQHSHLLRDIKGYIEILNQSKIGFVDFFIESTYTDSKGEERPCYLLTKKGCDMVANKMTGEKGVIFTAKYVTKFEEMEKQIQNQVITSELSPQLQLLINMELEQKKMKMELQETKKEVQAIKDIIVINPRAEWRKQTNNILNSIGYKTKEYQKVKEEAYKALEERGKCNLKIRLENLQGRALREGMAPSKAKTLNYLDVIENDIRLKEIYIGIVKEMAIKNGITITEQSE